MIQYTTRCPLCRSKTFDNPACPRCVMHMAPARPPTPEELARHLAYEERERERKAARAAELARRLALGRPLRVAVVGCGKVKRDGTHQARDLYTGGLFRAALAHAERTADLVVIASALYGLVRLDQEITTYDRRLSDYRLREREAWGIRFVGHLLAELAGQDAEVVIYAGNEYAKHLRPELRRAGLAFSEPLAGLGVGERLGWFRRTREATAAPAEPVVFGRRGQAELFAAG